MTEVTVDRDALAEEMLTPGEWFHESFTRKRIRTIVEYGDRVEDADIVLVRDSDADGLGVDAVMQEAFSSQTVVSLPAGHREPLSVKEAGAIVAEYAPEDVDVVIGDLCPNDGEAQDFIKEYEDLDGDITVVDHHQWTDEAREIVGEVANLVIDTDECTTTLTLDEFYPDAPEWLVEFAEVTKDHDIWIKEDERSDDLSDFAFWAEPEEYVEVAREHGANITDDPEVAEYIEEKRAEKQAKVELAVENGDMVEVASLDMLLAYGSAYSSGVGQYGKDERDADVVVTVKPWNKVSIRSRDEHPVAVNIARELGGGGHDCAAGAEPEVAGKNGDISYEEHWETEGEKMKEVVVEAAETALESIGYDAQTAEAEAE